MRMEEFIINVYCLQWHASFAMKTDILCFSLIICWADNCRFVGGGANGSGNPEPVPLVCLNPEPRTLKP